MSMRSARRRRLPAREALLALQALEETENNAGDAELGALADDIEEYVVEAADEVDLRGGRRRPSATAARRG